MPDFTRVMTTFLQKEVLDDHFSKLEQAGHSPENRIPLEKVFIDLPTFADRRAGAPDEKDNSKPLPPGFLHEILGVGSMCLKPDIAASTSGIGTETQTEAPEPGRYVLIGGPGQGKSTLAQFLCQIHRTALLSQRKSLDIDVKKAIRSIETHCETQNLSMAIARRFPIRIELARFAKALASQGESAVNSVLSYVVFQIKDRTNHDITVDELRRWLQEYPWLVVLDGLDEVPASSNRGQVMIAVRDFLVDISTTNADVLLLATTRPQGYNDEFSPNRYRHCWLAPLSIRRAMHYGKTLVELTYAYSLQREKEVLTRLTEASKVDATARLMESPLQVTIMARLLAQVAQPPQERYKLFQQYYRIIYRREMERGVPVLSQLLRDYEADINAIHYRTGLLLQIESERTRYTDATISSEEFKAIVADRLSGEGHPNPELSRLTESIAASATDRLVFLVPSQSGRVGFEIRSLQEFMAAEALMDGADEIVVKRIRTIAAVPFWQNVLLFAAGKCFSERQWLRDSISQVCGELNDDPNDKSTRLTLAGARVAVSLLEDGPARRQPAYSQALARQVFSLMKLPPEDIHDRLADVYETEFESVYKEEVERQLAHADSTEHLCAWRLLIRLIDRKGISWARELADARWPTTVAEKQAILELMEPMDSHWLGLKYAEEFFRLPLIGYRHYIKDDIRRSRFGENKLARKALEVFRPVRERLPFHVAAASEIKLAFDFISIREKERFDGFAFLKDVHSYWRPLVEASKFIQHPARDTLAEALRNISHDYQTSAMADYTHFLPWPVSACLQASYKGMELKGLAERADAGEMGDYLEWEEAERRWKQRGVTANDLQVMTDDQWPLPRAIGKVGFPFAGATYSFEVVRASSDMGTNGLNALWRALPGGKMRKQFAPWVMYALLEGRDFFYRSRLRRTLKIDVGLVQEIVASMQDVSYMPAEILLLLYESMKTSGGSSGIFNLLGNRGLKIFGGRSYRRAEAGATTELTEFLTRTIESDSSMVGIFRLLSGISLEFKIERLPSNIANFLATGSPDITRCALLLKLADKCPTDESFKALAHELHAASEGNSDFFLSIVHCFENHQMDNSAAMTFLETLWLLVPRDMSLVRGRIMKLMLDLLGRRTSRLQEGDVWKEMALPPGLRDVLAN